MKPSYGDSPSYLCITHHRQIRNSIMRETWKIWALWLTAVSIVTVQADSDKSVTAAQVNGTCKIFRQQTCGYPSRHLRIRS